MPHPAQPANTPRPSPHASSSAARAAPAAAAFSDQPFNMEEGERGQRRIRIRQCPEPVRASLDTTHRPRRRICSTSAPRLSRPRRHLASQGLQAAEEEA